MHGVTFPRGTDGWSRHQANTLLRAVEDMFQRADVAGLVDVCTADCVFRFAGQPEQTGHVPLRQFLLARLARQQDYRLRRTCIAIDGNKLTNRWQDAWTDRESGKRMVGSGLEVWTMRDGKIAAWEAAFNARRESSTDTLAFLTGAAA